MTEYLVRNSDYLAAVKPPALCSEETADGSGFCNLLKAENEGFLAPVYRLDRGVGGVMLYARNPYAAAFFRRLCGSTHWKRNMRRSCAADPRMTRENCATCCITIAQRTNPMW